MSLIMTATGPISPEDIGFTTMHDHLLLDGRAAARENDFDKTVLDHFDGKLPFNPEEITLENLNFIRRGGFVVSDFCWDIDDVDLMKDEVRKFKEAGGSTILEVSTMGMRKDNEAPRNVEGLREISRDTSVNVVVSTGFYDEIVWPAFVHDMSIEDRVAYIKRDAEEGIEGTDIKAGAIKTGANKFTDNAVKNLKACARGAIKTGLCLTVHNGIDIDKRDSWEMIKLLLAEGVDPEKLVWAHIQNFANETNITAVLQNPDSYYLNLDFAKRVLDKGVTVSIDCFGNPCDMEYLGFWDRDDKVMICFLAKLLQAGYAGQMVVGHDVSWKPSLTRFGGDGFTRLPSFVIPALKKAGYEEKLLDQITVKNPARLLSR